MVWQWVRRDSERSSFGSKRLMSLAQIMRAARILATSMKKFMPIAQKKESRGANLSMASPASTPALAYSRPSASV